MEDEYIDLVDTVDRLKSLCKRLNLSKIVDGDFGQIDILSEMKERIEMIELERIDEPLVDKYKYQA
tara:strand:- start:285 stop:482 length:198 start_codon:yes stop_codon:yes gene_type:complete